MIESQNILNIWMGPVPLPFEIARRCQYRLNENLWRPVGQKISDKIALLGRAMFFVGRVVKACKNTENRPKLSCGAHV